MPLSPKDLEEFLRSKNINFKIRFHGETYSAKKASEELGVSLSDIAKSILFISDDGNPLLVIVPGDKKINQSLLARMLGFKKLRLATAEEVLKFTGYEAGAVPPLGHKENIPVILDEILLAKKVIYAGGGSVNSTLEISPKDLEKLLSLRVMKVP
ncbi:MAG: YbaK/EbsC family protein [Thermoproteota archaeon]|nr:YbaK/EbsC family protein [Candidatus Brockarchaeota archaeon]MBO3801974.1 YbaK/EbsC family protein [Candidatus Brockarchaeota archaeon]